MHDPDHRELRRRLESLAPFFRALGSRTMQTYAAAGILAALPDSVFPVSDARFRRTVQGLTYRSHGPVYFTITRSGELELGGPGAGVPLAEAIIDYTQLVQRLVLGDDGPAEGATEWFPPPRFVLDTDTSLLYISSSGRTHEHTAKQSLIPVEQYIEEHAQLFVEAFRAVG